MNPGLPLFAGLTVLAVSASLLAGLLPLSFSIIIVFLFAGPHNLLEARYFLERLPARAGKLWPFFALAAVGVLGLTILYPLLPVIVPDSAASIALACWNTAFLGWVAALAYRRANTNPRRDWGGLVPLAFLALAFAWWKPYHFGLALVYLHPLIALWLLDRELGRSRPRWRPAYRCFLAGLPALLVGLVWQLHDAPPLPGHDALMLRIAHHSGSDWAFPGVSSHALVAAHAFLEMIHYGVWVFVMPMVGMKQPPWTVSSIPAAKRSAFQRRIVAGVLLVGMAFCAMLWAGFSFDYLTTRDVYFTIATAHVLAEIPFLLRSL